MVEEALQSWRELGDKWWMAVALEHIGFMLRLEGDFEAAVAPLEEGVSLARSVEDRWPLARCLVRLAGSFIQTDPAASLRLYEEGVAIARSVGDRSILSEGLVGLAGAHFFAGNLAAAAPIGAEALAEARAIGSVTNVFLSLLGLAVLSCLQGDPAAAKGYCLELLALGRETGTPIVQFFGVFASGFVACFGGGAERGVRMLAAAQALAGQRGISFVVGGGGGFNLLYQMAVERARAQLEPAAWDEAMREGQALTLDQAFEVATED